MYNKLKENVLKANIELKNNNLVILTWGNVSECDRKLNAFAIKPSGVPYDKLTVNDIVVLDMEGNIIEGELNPSVDMPTHLYLYNKYPYLKGITHTHSTYATAYAQAGKPIIPYGTTHADYFYGKVSCARSLSCDELKNNYERNTAIAIAECVGEDNIIEKGAILVKSHGVFTFGKSAMHSVENAIVVEEISKMASISYSLNNDIKSVSDELIDTHYIRKHGKNARYGQNEKK